MRRRQHHRRAAAAVVLRARVAASSTRQLAGGCAAKGGVGDGSGTLSGAYVGSMIALMIASPSRGCSAASGDSLAKNGAVRPVDDHRRDRGVVCGLQTHIGQRNRELSKAFRCHGRMGKVRRQTFGPFWSKKSARFASGKRLAHTDVSERASKITNLLQSLRRRPRWRAW